MKIKVCTWKMCTERFSQYIITRLQNDKIKFNLDKLEIENCMCLWKCSSWPNIVVDWNIKKYVNPLKASWFIFNNNKKK